MVFDAIVDESLLLRLDPDHGVLDDASQECFSIGWTNAGLQGFSELGLHLSDVGLSQLVVLGELEHRWSIPENTQWLPLLELMEEEFSSSEDEAEVLDDPCV